MSILRQLSEIVSLRWKMRGGRLDKLALEALKQSSETAGVFVPRPISDQEIAIIRLTLAMDATQPIGPDVLDRLSELQAKSGCPCGCESVDFQEFDPERRPGPLAHSIGTTIEGRTVGIIIWGLSDAVASIEVYDLELDGADIKVRLPIPSSLKAFETRNNPEPSCTTP
jgi:hypothetical protein